MKNLFYILSLFTISAFGQTPLSYNPRAFYDVTNPANLTVSGTNVVTVTDLTGHGYNLTQSGNPQYTTAGINNLPSIQFNGANRLQFVGSLGRTDTSKLSGYIVFKLTATTGVTYQMVLMVGATNYSTTGDNFYQIQNPNNTNQLISNLRVTDLKHTFTDEQLFPHFLTFEKTATEIKASLDGGEDVIKSGVQTVNDNGVYIGQWMSRGAKMLFSEMCIFDDANPPDWNVIKEYLGEKYGIAPTIEVTNEGVAGITTAGTINRLSTINANNYDLAYVMLGTNDYRHPDAAQRVTPEQYKINLTTIVQSLKANGTEVVLMPILPTVDSKSMATCTYYGQPTNCDSDALAEPFVTAMAEVAQEQSVYFLNTRARFFADCLSKDNACSAFNSDGFHLNANGTLELALDMFKFYKAANFTYSNIGCIGDSNFANLYLPAMQTVPAQLKTLLNN